MVWITKSKSYLFIISRLEACLEAW